MATVAELQFLKKATKRFLKEAGHFSYHTFKVSEALLPLTQLIASDENITQAELSAVIDRIFEILYEHPLTQSTKKLTQYLRQNQVLPNEESTEQLIRYVVEQITLRSPVAVPEAVVTEFWNFFQELFSEPELKGLGELNLDMFRLVLKSYEPLIVELLNLLKEMRFANQGKLHELLHRTQIVRGDLYIIQRQIKALRYIKPFFQTDPKDFQEQACIVAKMVQEFGPFFIKIAQVAATTSDFLPEEIAKELMLFQEDVPPMTAEEVLAVFRGSTGKDPHEVYFGFDAKKPIRSGSIGSVYLAKKPVNINGREVLKPVIIKVGRYNLDREFLMGKTVLGLALLSSQYWAPHSKLAPFLSAMQQQVDEFVRGFQEELNFEHEATIQERFFQRSLESNVWKVPQVYKASPRVLEMEFLNGAQNISAAFRGLKQQPYKQRQVAQQFLFSVLTQLLVYQEVHGDLHPGNIMLNEELELFLIDWGNVVDMRGKWKPLWDYLSGALSANTFQLTEALIRLSTTPSLHEPRFYEVQAMLDDTLKKKGVSPLSHKKVSQLYKEGTVGLHRRFQVMLHLLSNTQHLGIVVRSEYLHLSRSLLALVGTYISLYENHSKLSMALDISRVLSQFPLLLTKDRLAAKKQELRNQLRQKLRFRKN